MVDEINVSKPHSMRAFIVENTKSDAEADWMDEMERELQETEKKWPMTGINWKP